MRTPGSDGPRGPAGPRFAQVKPWFADRVNRVFDYVIVGGGSAGCVVAARLAEDPGSRVLLLEAGPDASAVEEVRVPAAYSRLFRSQYDWNYVTLPQERADERPVYWPGGKALGGSSILNAMIYVRGNRLDYDT
jgi:choline dehydrogenase-like flavoprotein